MQYTPIFILLFCCSAAFGQQDYSANLTQQITKDLPYLSNLYQHYHSHPELSFQEEKTSKTMAEELRTIGFEVTENIGGFGVVGVYKNGEGPTILVRADMDALPIKEETGLPFASSVETTKEDGSTIPVMHACGHDIHMTVWAGTARLLINNTDQWRGTLVFLGQPAEERAGGAKAMLADGLYERFPVPDYALAIHVSSSLKAGTVGYTPKYAMANVDMVDITVFGKGGHGAYPHTTKDPVVLAARIINALQTIVSREISPLEPAVVSVGSIHGGTKGNVIPNEVMLELTLRSYSDEVRNALIEKIERICKGVAFSAGLSEELFPKVFVRDEHAPSLFNDEQLADKLGKVFIRCLGKENVEVLPPTMVGEDFGQFGRTNEKVPIFLFWLGSVHEDRFEAAQNGELELPSLHSSTYYPDYENTIKTGVLCMGSAVMELLHGE